MDPLEYSRYARHVVGARPELRRELDSGEAWTRDAMRAFLGERAAADEAALQAGLRALRQRVVLRTMGRDLAGRAPLAEVCTAMTALAEVAVESALAFLEPALEGALGTPLSGGERARMIVVGMGKLGGGELNVSSDVDLVFLYPEEGETRPSTSSARSVPNLEFFTRLGRRLIAALGEATGDGFVFRVDMRLRPWGDDGPLATSFDALEEYFVTQGREWERYAWIKARALADRDSPALAAIVRPFVYRKYLDYGAIAAMRELHAQIRAEVARRELADHIKLGPGGIREIEFIAQAFQLIRGGRDAPLQVRPTLEVLALLAARNLLPRAAVEELSEAYVFLRRLEHRIQYLDDAQTHELPENDEDRARVAAAMGFASWDAFREGLERRRERVSWHFEQVFSVEERPRHALAPIWTAEAGEPPAARLAAIGYRDPEAAAARLAAVRSGSRYGGLPQGSRERFDALVPRLVEAAAAQEDPDTTLARGLDFAETISRRAAYLALLDEHPAVLARLAQLLGASSWAAQYLNRHPVLVDELLDARTLFAPPDWSAFAQSLRRELAARAGDEERQMDWLREAHHAQVFRLLAQDLSGELTVERLADHLSDLADVVLQATLELAWTQLRVRHREIPQFAVIAYGKLGGKELGYASDLDLIFLHDDPHEQAQEVYAKLAQRVSRLLTSRTAAGVLFDIDLRLRPDGEGGMVVSSIDAFRRYQREAAWTWERQALTRARYAAGDAAVGAAFEEERRRVLRERRDQTRLRDEVLEMRARLLEGHPNASELFDLKHDRGGMIDIEFIVQYLVLAYAHAHPELVANDGNIALLRLAARLGLIPAGEAEAVGDAYRDFRRLQHKLRLNGARYARVPADQVRRSIDATLSLWEKVLGEKPS